MTSYNDTDVQDKARFYYALMTSASDKKVTICENTSNVKPVLVVTCVRQPPLLRMHQMIS